VLLIITMVISLFCLAPPRPARVRGN
jgi:hypothetical protein